MRLYLLAAYLALPMVAGCSAPLRDTLITSANAAREIEVTAADELHTRCTLKYQKAPPPPVADLDRVCLPMGVTYRILRAARLAALAALSSDDKAAMLKATADLAAATGAAVKAAKELP